MKLFILSFILVFASCERQNKPDGILPVGKNESILISPNQTNINYAAANEDHYIVRNSTKRLNKLMLFIGGSYSIPQNYNGFCDHAASAGYDVVSISYPNGIAAASLSNSVDPLVFDKYREEICFGAAKSNDVDVDELNSIKSRLINLLSYLGRKYSNQNWTQYLTADRKDLLWAKICLAGHSQGSGHACFIGKKHMTDRVLMFSGPNDYSDRLKKSANWLTEKGLTSNTKQFVLLHAQDEIVPFSSQVLNVQALGLLSLNELPFVADNAVAPYSQKNALSINIKAFSNHSSTIGQNPILKDIWNYMLTN